MGRGENIRYHFRPQNEAGSGDRRLPDCGFSTDGAATLADGSPGSPGRRSARLRVSFRIRRHALASGQLHRAGVVSSLAPLAPTGLGSVSYHARGAAELRGVSAVLPGNTGCPPRIPPRSLGPDPGSCRDHDPRAQFWPVLSGFPALDHRTGILLLSGPRAMEPGNRPGPVVPAGKGAGSRPQRPRPGRSLVWLTGLSAAWILVVLGLIELALGSGSADGRPWLAGLFQKAFQSR